MPPNSTARARNRSSSGAFAYVQHDPLRNQHHTPLMNHASTVHPVAAKTPPLRPVSAAQDGETGMSAASRYAHNLKVLRRRDPSILRIFDQFSHVCVYHHNGQQWEKKGFEGSMFLYERAEYPPYGFYILNRMGMDDYIQRLWPEDNVGVHGNYLMLRTWPEYSRKRVNEIQAALGGQEIDPFDNRYKWDGQNPPAEGKTVSQTIGLWMFATDAREPMIDVMMRLHNFIKQNLPYPEEFRYGPDKPPPPNPHTASVNGTPNRTSSAASSISASSSHGSSLGSSSSQLRRNSPNTGYINPLLYQATDSTSTANAKLQPLELVNETPKKKTRRRKEKEKVLEERGDMTPMAKNTNQISDLEMLFAKLVKPSGSTSDSSAIPGPSSAGREPSLLETLMGSGSASSASSNSAPTSTTKVTLEGLFATAEAVPPADDGYPSAPKKLKSRNKKDGSKHHREALPENFTSSRKQTGSAPNGQQAVPAPINTGLALLNDIFASASASSVTPSEYMPDEDDASVSASADVDPPETIEIHSPRPQAPLSLASMFDAAAVDPSPSPATISGLGLGLEHVQLGVRQGQPMILTQQVMDHLLGKGGSIDIEDEPIPSSEGTTIPQSISVQDAFAVNDAQPEEVRRKLLAMIGLGTQAQSSSLLHVNEVVGGDVTPRAKANDIQSLESPSIHRPMGKTSTFLSNPDFSVHNSSVAPTDYSASDEDEEEAIVELDFSDTRALSDLHAFENRERVLREQLIERRAASRNASRSGTPSVMLINSGVNQNGIKGAVSKNVARSVETAQVSEKNDFRTATTPPVASQAQPQTIHVQAPGLTKVDSSATLRPTSPVRTVQKPDVPATPHAETASTDTMTPVGTPSSSKKKTRRGRGRGKDKEGQSSPTPDASRSHSAVEDASVMSGADATAKEPNGQVQEGSPKPVVSLGNAPAGEITGAIRDSQEVPSKLKDYLYSTLSRRNVGIETKERLVELTVMLLQTDSVFVDDLWNAWEGKATSATAGATPNNLSTSEIFLSSSEQKLDQQPTVKPTSTPPPLTQSAPALLPTIAQLNGSSHSTPPRSVVTENSPVSPIVKDVASLEALRVVEASAEAEEEQPDFGEEENYVVESLL